MEEIKTEPKIMLVQETPMQSYKKDAGTVVACLALVLPGWLIGSAALQWVGAMMFVFWLIARVFGTSKDNTYTLDQAKAKIDAMLEDRRA